MSDPAAEYAAWQADISAKAASLPKPCAVATMRRMSIQWSRERDARDLLKSRELVQITSTVSAESSYPLTPSIGTIVYVHGAVQVGSTQSYHPLTARLCAAASAHVLAVEYRRPPEVRFPAPLVDLLVALRWLNRRKIPMNKIVIAGDSFGAMPALAATMRLRDAGAPTPRGLYLLCPDTDYSNRTSLAKRPHNANPRICTVADAMNGYFDAPRYPCTSPEATPGLQSLVGLPPILMHESRPKPLLHALQLRDRLLAEPSVDFTFRDWPDVPHIWPYYGDAFTYGAEAIAHAAAWIKQRLS